MPTRPSRPSQPAPRAAGAAAPSPLRALDSAAVRAWGLTALGGLAAAREEIDALNVYPVPDGDTGTNLYLTVEAAVQALEELPAGAGPGELLAALARGALLGARGNSGVILSQVLRGVADAVAEPGSDGPPQAVDPPLLAAALRRGADAAYAAVAHPVEGTMLTVLRSAAGADPGADGLAALVAAAHAAARDALARTPDQLEVLRRAGVVDAGGRGVCELLAALERVVTGDTAEAGRPPARRGPRPRAGDPVNLRATRAQLCEEYEEGGGPAYEVMFLLEAPAAAVPALRERLERLGDSVLVVGADPTWNVHVHVDDVGAAVEAGIAAGRPHGIRVTALHQPAPDGARARAVVSVVAGDGLGALFEAAGATVVTGGPGRRASTAELLDGIRRANARDLVLLPNDADSLAVAQAAAARAREDGLRVAVIPTRASVQALAALAVHDPERRFEEDVLAMTAAAGHCRHGGVTVASREAVTMAGVCRAGDVLGIVEGDFVLIGAELTPVACAVVDRMLGSGGELVTLVLGADAGPGLATAVVAHLRRTRPEVDTVVYDGGQPRYPLLLGVE